MCLPPCLLISSQWVFLPGSIKVVYWQKWAAVAVIPLIAGVGLLLLYLIVVLRKVSLAFSRRGRVRQLRIVETVPGLGAARLSSASSVAAEAKPGANAHHVSGESSLDAFIGIYTTALYFLYFVVVRNSLTIFSCSLNEQGVRTMKAEPSIVCSSSDSQYPRLFFWAMVFTVLYGLGIPLSFFSILWYNRRGIRVDQELRKVGEGDSPGQNPFFAIRHRFSKLYQDFKPECSFWRICLIIRKLCLVLITLFAHDPLFQAIPRSLVLPIVFL